MNKKNEIQAAQYHFPYHHVPYLNKNGHFFRFRSMRWGFAYLCLLYHLCDYLTGKSGRRLLDIGCGDGKLLSLLAARSDDWRLSGVDCVTEAARMAAAFTPSARIVNDDKDLAGETLSFVTLIEVLEHLSLESIGSMIEVAAARLETGGEMIISVPTLNKPFSAKHFRHYDNDLLLKHVDPAKYGLETVSQQYIFNGSDPVFNVYSRLTENRFWFIAVDFLEQIIWRRVWTRLRTAQAANGHHLLLILKKT
jgi:cyclopropane fatty-acyl-phospholipid synthase-like methyltransferase